MSKIIGFIGFFISLLGFTFDLPLPSWLHFTLVIISVISFVVAVIFETIKYFKSRPYSFNRQKNIDYMEKIIKCEGQIIIFAGRLSWVDNESIKKAIIDKKNDLYLCVNSAAPYIEEFRKAGVNVFTYGDESFLPNTHFTIIRKDKPSERIAIASIKDSHKKEKRLVYELHKNPDDFISNWIMYAANDLFRLVEIINKLEHNPAMQNHCEGGN